MNDLKAKLIENRGTRKVHESEIGPLSTIRAEMQGSELNLFTRAYPAVPLPKTKADVRLQEQ